MTVRTSLVTLALFAHVTTTAAARPPKRATGKEPRPSAEQALAEKIVDQLVAVLSGQSKFRVSGCPEVTPTQWASLLLLNDGIPMTYAFTEGCDVEGETVLRREPFAVDLKLRQFPGAERLKATVEAEAKPEWATGIVRAEVRFRDATLEGKVPVGFTAAVRVATGLEEKSPDNVAGEIRLYRVRGQDVDARRKFP